ncbi:DUF3604 domain-containing protein [Oceanicoccus sagamiensis]|nr:DUF3604 domain-containing protein [Oceanicoccus sagamiensis]
MRTLLLTLVYFSMSVSAAEEKQLLWGDTHLHTTYSSDAYTNGNLTADPNTAYRYARGLPVLHPYHQAKVKIETPLDFLVVTDHAELLGVIRTIHRDGVDYTGLGLIDSLKAWVSEMVLRYAIDSGDGRSLFSASLPEAKDAREAAGDASFSDTVSVIPEMMSTQRDTWQDITNMADQHNEPGVFSALIGWEWSPLPGGSNLHRVVITDGDAESAQRYQPFSLYDSQYPEDLWAWLEQTAPLAGADFIAIPHNSNISKGFMFDETSLRGKAIDKDYAELRMKWEPIVEITQFKGDSETHPSLSPDDEFADFEAYENYIQRDWRPYEAKPGDYVRSALKRGLTIEQRAGSNPYQFGVVGSTDAHTSLPTANERNFQGKHSPNSIPANNLNSAKKSRVSGWNYSASGLTAVWATENTRSSILAAMKRKEVYATTGPRIRLQFFAIKDVKELDLTTVSIYQQAAKQGVPMGGEIRGGDFAAQKITPSFVVQAMKDPVDANLDRIQIVKGWVDETGAAQEKVYDVVWSDERQLDDDGRLPAVKNTVDTKTAMYENSVGAAQLAAVWYDPDFNPAHPAFYYARVLQIPTPRHSLYDAVALEREKADGFPDTIQERAYSSAIWYKP